MYRALIILGLATMAAFPSPLMAEEPVDLDMINRIRDEGFHRSQVMETAYYLTEVIGPRLSNSPQMREANVWTKDKLREWGLKNASVEPWGEFGRGWSFQQASLHMLRPHAVPLIALPKAWTPGTDGPVRGLAMKVSIKEEEDFEEYEGKLSGKILLMADERDVRTDDTAIFKRHSEEALADMEKYNIPGERSDDFRASGLKRWRFQRKVAQFLTEENVLAVLELSSRDAGVIRVGGNRSYEVGEDPGPPILAVATEHYNRILRMLEKEVEVELELDIAAQFHEEDTTAYNTIAEIPGTTKRNEIVMLGGHMDSWHAGQGATDNASGVSVAMEAVRILMALDVRPKRTIRIALWSGEEQGLLGSRAYVAKHFADRPESDDPEQAELPRWYRRVQWPIQTKPDHKRFSVYFNLDNGSGKIRGIYCQENDEVRPIFETWLKPFADLGATAVSLRNTGSTDHVSFNGVGLPGFQFIQDPLEYSTRTHHSNMDVYDRLQRRDLMQASVIMASFVYHAAMRDEKIPRKALPEEDPRRKAERLEKEAEEAEEAGEAEEKE